MHPNMCFGGRGVIFATNGKLSLTGWSDILICVLDQFSFSGYFVVGCWEWQMHPTCVWEGVIFYKQLNALWNLSYCPNLSCNKGQSLVIRSASKMIHLSGIFVVRKGKYNPICVLGSFFATNGKNANKNCNNCQKLSTITM